MLMGFPGAHMVKIYLQCGRPGFDPWIWEDPLEKGTVTHSSILAWKIPWTEEPGRLQPMELQRDTTERLLLSLMGQLSAVLWK